MRHFILGLAFALTAASAHAATAYPNSIERCPTTRNLAAFNWGERPLPPAKLDGLEADTRGSVARPTVPADADIVMRSFAGPSETLSVPTDSVATIWRTRDGRWRFDHVDFEHGEAKRRVHTFGALDSDQARRLDALFANPCLDLEPTQPGVEMFVKPGVEPIDNCYSGAGGIVEVIRGGRRRVLNLTCPRLLSGELTMIAINPTLDGTVRHTPQPQAFASVAAARARADAIIAERKSREWRNVTTGTIPRLRHDPDGTICTIISRPDYGGGVSDSAPEHPDWPAGCSSSRDERHTSVRIFPPTMAIDEALSRWAPLNEHAPYREAAQVRPLITSVRLDGYPTRTLVLIDRPRGDARREIYSRLYGRKVGASVITVEVTGAADDRHQIDEWAKVRWREALGK